jgi:hypothetical protein
LLQAAVPLALLQIKLTHAKPSCGEPKECGNRLARRSSLRAWARDQSRFDSAPNPQHRRSQNSAARWLGIESPQPFWFALDGNSCSPVSPAKLLFHCVNRCPDS